MSKHQACGRCGAQFDVSAFAPGQKFTCGACGAVVTAGAAPAARPAPAPAAPSRPIPAPSRSSSASGSPRGPQYVPVERHAVAASAAEAPARRDRKGREGRDDDESGDRASRRHRDERGGRPAKRGLSTGALFGIAGGFLVLTVGALLLILKSDEKKKDAGGGAAVATNPSGPGGAGSTGPGGASAGLGSPGAGTTGKLAAGGAGATGMGAPASPSGADSLAAVEGEWKQIRHPTPEQYREFMSRYKALGPAGAEPAKRVAREMLEQADPNDKAAHELLGHREFTYDVPEEISFRKYPFVRAVEEAHAQRWFEDPEGYELAVKAYEKAKRHAQRLETDRVYRALDGARREIDRDEYLKKYNYDAIFAAHYLICYSSDERIDEEDFIKLSKPERSKKMAELEKKKEGYRRILAEKAKIFPQLYAEFMRRYGEECELKPLMDEFGGRPDYPASKKSFRDGCPLIVWIFSDKKAFSEYHEKVKKDPINPGIAGYFSPATGWVYLYDEDNGDREFEVNKNVHEGTHQLEHWFQRQMNEWVQARVPQSFFGEGFAEFMGAVTMEKYRKITFVGLNRPRLESLRGAKDALAKMYQKMPTFPVKDLVSFEGYDSVGRWAGEHWQGPQMAVNPLILFYVQSWALVYFMNEYQGHKYQKAFIQFLDDMLNYPKDAEHYTFEKFKRAMKLQSEEDWKRLDKEFQGYYLGTLAAMDLKSIGKKPPLRDDWPGYAEPDPLTPDEPVKKAEEPIKK